MLASLLVMSCLGCTDRSPTLPNTTLEPVLVATIQCTADVRTLQMVCADAGPQSGGPSRALYGTSQVKLQSSNVLHDSVTGIFGMDVIAQNLMSYTIGTADGQTSFGLKVFFEKGPTATYYTAGDTGTVRVRNPDGYQNITGSQQPYHLYDTILQPQQITDPKRWEFTVPSTVKSFGFTVRIFTATQQEQRVPMRAPEGEPRWFYAPENSVPCQELIAGPCLTNVVTVQFHESSSQEERQSAIDHIKGAVVGGLTGMYYVQISSDGTLDALRSAINHLRALPQVGYAGPFSTGLATGQYLTPTDTSLWSDWKLDADSADGSNWALEQIGAPYAWGCAVGTGTTPVAVIDDGFQDLSDLRRQVDVASSFGFPTTGSHQFDHGTRVAGVLAAYGNDTTQITGVMWRARLIVRNAGVDSSGARFYPDPGVPAAQIWRHLRIAGESGARVINLSLGWEWPNNPGAELDPLVRLGNDEAVRQWYVGFKAQMDTLAARKIRPLIVFSAGNQPNVDARWNIARIAADSTDQFGVPYNILIVGASTRNQQLASFSSPGRLVTIAAPGEEVTVLHGDGRIASNDPSRPAPFVRTGSGTSISAPHVAGVAGLLFSFDPRLTAADVKNHIIDGAVRGGRVAGTGGLPILNARESLILAGRAAGAPLCNNRIWIHERTAYAQRDPASTAGEALFTLPSSTVPGSIDALHGGKAIHLAGRPGQVMRWTSSGWEETPVPATSYPWFLPDANGTVLSRSARSHSVDTLFSIRSETSGNLTTFRFRLESTSGTVDLPDSISRPYANGPYLCVQTFDSINSSAAAGIDTTPGLTEAYRDWRKHVGDNAECVANGGAQSIRHPEARAAYAPEGRYAFVYISERVGSSSPGTYSACRTQKTLSYENPAGEVKYASFYVYGQCRPTTTTARSGQPVIYRVNLVTGATNLHAWTGDPIAHGDLVYLGLGEDGKEAVVHVSDRARTDQYTWVTVSPNLQALRFSYGPESRTCVHQFRSFATGSVVFAPPATCAEVIGISANREQ